MRSFAAITLAVVACLLAGAAPAAAADNTMPRSAAAFRDSVGVTTHIVYFDTPYGDWERVVDRLDELGVRHLRDGANGNPGPEWRDWNERYYRAVELAADRGMRFLFEMGRPGNRTGTLDELLAVVGGRLRRATEALEAPNEFDHFNGGPRWPAALRDYTERLYRGAKAHPALRSLPVLGPSLGTWEGPRRAGDHRAWLDRGNIHPYTGGASPSARHVRVRARAGQRRLGRQARLGHGGRLPQRAERHGRPAADVRGARRPSTSCGRSSSTSSRASHAPTPTS